MIRSTLRRGGFYNFTKIHNTLRTTPAMAAGLTDRVWDMSEIVALIEDAEMLLPATHANGDTTR
jgi:hypothetical protein